LDKNPASAGFFIMALGVRPLNKVFKMPGVAHEVEFIQMPLMKSWHACIVRGGFLRIVKVGVHDVDRFE
jgi:hypothetical protein